MAIYANITLDQGSDFSSVVSVLSVDGLAFDLTGYTARGQIRKTYTSINAVTLTCNVQSPESDGNIQISLSSAQTGAMKSGRYLFDIEIIDGTSGSVSRVVEGQIEVNPRITHS